MALMIKGIRLTSFSLEHVKDDGTHKIKGGYELMSNTDVVLAKQSVNGYGEMEVAFSAETQELKMKFLNSIKKDIETTLGLSSDTKE